LPRPDLKRLTPPLKERKNKWRAFGEIGDSSYASIT
jgi:hypothetical protein